VQEALDDGCPLAELERTLLADGDTADDVAAAWLFAWSYDELRRSSADSRLKARIAQDVRNERTGRHTR
jgi:hypothetical protein